jgi:hypothetical protein
MIDNFFLLFTDLSDGVEGVIQLPAGSEATDGVEEASQSMTVQYLINTQDLGTIAQSNLPQMFTYDESGKIHVTSGNADGNNTIAEAILEQMSSGGVSNEAQNLSIHRLGLVDQPQSESSQVMDIVNQAEQLAETQVISVVDKPNNCPIIKQEAPCTDCETCRDCQIVQDNTGNVVNMNSPPLVQNFILEQQHLQNVLLEQQHLQNNTSYNCNPAVSLKPSGGDTALDMRALLGLVPATVASSGN